MAIKVRLRSLLLVFMVFLVKSPHIYSEEHTDRFNRSLNTRQSVVIGGKIFSVIMVTSPPVVKKLKPEYIDTELSLQIIGKGKMSSDILSAFLTRYNPALNPVYALKVATIYIEEADDEGVNHDLAFSQMCLETAFLKFGGDVLPSQNNFCGLGVTGGGVRGASFCDIRAGVRAHIQHLKAYASKRKIVNPIIDNRFKYVKRGSAPDVFSLTGKWATDHLYGNKIKSLMEKLSSIAQNG